MRFLSFHHCLLYNYSNIYCFAQSAFWLPPPIETGSKEIANSTESVVKQQKNSQSIILQKEINKFSGIYIEW